MANIVSSNGTDKLTVDTTSNAARVTLYDSEGNELNSQPTGSYMTSFYIRNATTDTSNSDVFALVNGNTKQVFIRRVWGMFSFDGTAVAGDTRRVVGVRLSNWDRSIGWTDTAQAALKKRTSYAASAVSRIVWTNSDLASGQTTEDTVLFNLAIPISSTGTYVPFDFQFEAPNNNKSAAVIDFEQVLQIRWDGAARTAGQSLACTVEWDER